MRFGTLNKEIPRFFTKIIHAGLYKAYRKIRDAIRYNIRIILRVHEYVRYVVVCVFQVPVLQRYGKYDRQSATCRLSQF